MTRRGPGALAPLWLGLALCACEQADPNVTYHYAEYAGVAFPDRRPKVEVPAAGMGVVTDSRSDTISLIDLGTGQRFAVYPVGREPITLDGPHHVAVDAAHGFLYIALSYPVLAGSVGPHATHGSSTVSGWAQKLSLSDLSVVGQVQVDANPGEISLAEDGSRVVVSHFDLKKALDNPSDPVAARSNLVVIDPSTMVPVGSPAGKRIPVCIAAHGMALSRPKGDVAYVACYGEDGLGVVDLTTGEVEVIPVGPSPSIGNPTYGPYALVLSPDQKTVAVSTTTAKDVRFYDVATKTFDESRTVKTVGTPYFVAWTPDSQRIYIPTQKPDAVVEVDLANGNQELLYRDLTGECDNPHVADLSSGPDLFVVCEGDQTAPGKVVRLGVADLGTLSVAPAGVYPDAFVRVPGGAK